MTNSTTTVNGTAVSFSQAHRLFASHLDLQDRFESGRPIAGHGARDRLANLAVTLTAAVVVAWNTRKSNAFAARVACNELVHVESELGSLVAETPLAESFHLRTAGWVYDPNTDRLDGDIDELLASADDAAAETVKMRFELHRVRKSTANRVQLAKLGLVGRFSWADAWADAKAQMRSLGADIRANESWCRLVEREEILRDREEEEKFNKGVTECDQGYDLPSDDDQQCWSARDLAEMSRG